ncbi:MAG TPA: BrnT family toxin [Pyrinomonadaceae bacterium]|nr:BrnT family toxin [Pyrinomonadaceae bacterium]
MKVTWDEKKRKQVIKDHGVDLAKIEDILDDPYAIDFGDAGHSTEEERRILVGKTAAYGLVAVVYTVRGQETRFITARRAENWMVREYETQRRRY